MSVLSVDAVVIGRGNALLEVAVVGGEEVVVEEDLLKQEIFVTDVENLAILPKTVIFMKMLVTTVEEVAILQKTAGSQKRRGSSVAITVANLVIWLAIVIMQMSRSAIPVGNLATSKKIAPK